MNKNKQHLQRRPKLLRGAYGRRGVHVFFFKKKSKTKSSDGLNYYAARTDVGAYIYFFLKKI